MFLKSFLDTDYADFTDSHGKNLLLNPRQSAQSVSAQSVKSVYLRNGLFVRVVRKTCTEPVEVSVSKMKRAQIKSDPHKRAA
ncbi:MAG: hypothetical protein DCC59_08625 [Chloroflexi bacterium]|nr:MAG: hypothetical protein DCC59_08625 [Chloroflexota bacterium]